MKYSENFKSMSKRIKSSKTLKDLEKLEKSLARIYDAGFFTVAEFRRLDSMILARKIKYV